MPSSSPSGADDRAGATDDASADLVTPTHSDAHADLEAYIAFLEGIPSDNAIARRFIGAAHMLARAVLVNAVFVFLRGLDFSWEDSAQMTGDILNMSRSSVARAVSDVDRLIEFWNAAGYHITRVEDVVEQISVLTKERVADALKAKAEEEKGEDPEDEK